jgi:cysteine desulfurase/selenocysteine lyase
VEAVRRRFPALAGSPGAPLAELDNAATTHKPQAVLDALMTFYCEHNANVHRAAHRRAREATEAYESARRRVARFLGAESGGRLHAQRDGSHQPRRALLRRAAPEGRPRIVTSSTPQQPRAQVCGGRARRSRSWPSMPQPAGHPRRAARAHALPSRRRAAQRDRQIGTEALVALAHRSGAAVLLDVSQAVGHLPLDAGLRAADFLAFSAHKLYGPMGLGILRGRREHLDAMQPIAFGGEMVARVGARDAEWQRPPQRFEPGTPAAAEAAAFVPALDLLDELTLPAIRRHELALLERLLEGLAAVPGVRVVGPPTAASARARWPS